MPGRRYSLGQRLLFRLAGTLGSWVARAWFATCRVQMLSPEEEARIFGRGRQGVGVTWHRGAIFFLYYFGKVRPAIMVSRSKDGEYLARFIAAMGGRPVRGSTAHGGAEALRQMADMLQRREVLYAATVADGPRGPRYRAQRGMVVLAQRTGLPLFPIMWSADRVLTLRKTWDKTMLPLPFSRVVIKAGPELSFPAGMGRRQMEAARQELEDQLDRLRDELDTLTGYRDPE
jgi:hypothetical protein